eukprot:12704864-Alexandrium_andersonii.AAC.1
MSASLVGSEMCIRDRLIWVWLQERLLRFSDESYDTALRALWGDFRESVSYTHLTLPTICSV